MADDYDNVEDGVDMELMFRIIAGTTREENWRCAAKTFDDSTIEHDGSVHYKVMKCSSCLVRLQFVVATSEQASSLVFPPEVSNESPSAQIAGFPQGKLEKQLHPGDAIVRVDPKAGDDNLLVHSLRSILESGHVESGCPEHIMGDDKEQENTGSHSLWDVYRARVIIRRGFPHPSMAIMSVIPLGKNHILNFQIGPVKSYAMTLQPHDQKPGHMIVSHLMSMPFSMYPSWATPHFTKLVQLQKKNFLHYLQTAEMQTLRTLDSNYYVILNIRGCNRGLPLLPLEESDLKSLEKEEHVTISDESGAPMHWIRWQGSEFTLMSYMRSFLKKFKIDIPVFDEMEKKKLVPYQVVVPRSHWAEKKEAVLKAFNLQKKAYRRMNGTSPKIGEAAEVRFQNEGKPLPKGCAIFSPANTGAFTVRKTFLELDGEKGYFSDDDHQRGWVGTKDKIGGALLRSGTFS
eukprot:TRINITY_DN10912_c0_g4_i1.p1 TRINITY_DN10912_c0_g4~~TRINITY_DN10912_c0_g4_i1.p1  ORF type:complete len:459 (-),score=69.51 TRINITY_DN10912_c0_g4_i1:120-1496(-)